LDLLSVDFKSAWFGLANSTEQYILRYESKYLREMGQVLEYLVSIGVTTAVQETLKHTVLASMYLSFSSSSVSQHFSYVVHPFSLVLLSLPSIHLVAKRLKTRVY